MASVVWPSCVPLELGDIPFKCNDGNPNCPDGYHCEGTKPDWVCVRDGFLRIDSALPEGDAAVTADAAVDFAPQRDFSLDKGWQPPDQGIPADQFVDAGPPVDAFVASDLPHLGCQDNVE